jgi:hypothetical protein
MQNAEIMFRDTANVLSKTALKGIPSASTVDMTKLLTFVTALKTYANAGIHAYTLLDWAKTVFTGDPPATIIGLNSIKSLVNIRFELDGETRYRNLWIPNPGMSTYGEITGVGFRMTPAALVLLSDGLTAMAGFDVQATEGKLTSKSWSQNRSKIAHSIEFQDSSSNSAFMSLPEALITDGAALDTFAGVLNDNEFSRSAILASYFLTKTTALPTPASGIGLAAADATLGEFTSSKTMATAKLHWMIDEKKYFEKISIGGVKNSGCEKSGSAWILKKATGDAIAAALITLYGSGNRDMKFDESKVTVHPN